MTNFGIVLSTAATTEEAERIATFLVEQRPAACVNVVPRIPSVYRWQGRIEKAEETLMLIKTAPSLLPSIEAAFCELHSYEVPELVLLPPLATNMEYLNWIDESLGF